MYLSSTRRRILAVTVANAHPHPRRLTKHPAYDTPAAGTTTAAAPIALSDPYPAVYHAGSFPWLLSAERQRIPLDPLATGGREASLPMAARRYLSRALNRQIALAALGAQAMEDIAAGAAMALEHIAELFSGSESSEELRLALTGPLFARFQDELGRLARDNVRLVLEVKHVNSSDIRTIRTQIGSAVGTIDQAKASGLRAGLARQAVQVNDVLGVVHAQKAEDVDSSFKDLVSALGGGEPVRIRVDVEVNTDMRYRLIGGKDGCSTTIVDDDATRNTMVTLESSIIDGTSPLEWRVADLDYLLSSEQRIRQEFSEANSI
ncbi:hypothetical protein EC988_003019 [Linderina pennispora]|nr:hypothetical protein EC988_003019 [Linderina pennispora]